MERSIESEERVPFASSSVRYNARAFYNLLGNSPDLSVSGEEGHLPFRNSTHPREFSSETPRKHMFHSHPNRNF